MGVVPGDPRSLTEIESHLAKSDPALVAWFAAFAGVSAQAKESMREAERQRAAPDPSQHARAKGVAVLIALVVLLALCGALAALASGKSAVPGILPVP